MKKLKTLRKCGAFFSAHDESRTRDLQFRKLTLYPIELRGHGHQAHRIYFFFHTLSFVLSPGQQKTATIRSTPFQLFTSPLLQIYSQYRTIFLGLKEPWPKKRNKPSCKVSRVTHTKKDRRSRSLGTLLRWISLPVRCTSFRVRGDGFPLHLGRIPAERNRS